MRYGLLMGLVMVFSSVALADTEPRFAKLRDSAEALTSLNSFVEHFVGNCGSALMGGAECEKNAEAFRKAATGKKYFMIVVEDSTSVLQMGEGIQGGFILNLTPFFAASDSALTHGAPSKTDSNGNPVMPYIRIESALPEGWNMGMMGRQVQAHALRMQLVFTVQGVWSLPKKGGGTIKGVKTKFDGVVVTVGRTGEAVGSWYSTK
jgi:hypothetical protein